MTDRGTVLVTGGARRLGRAIALRLAEAGWDLALHYRSSADAAEELAERIRTAGRTCRTFQADLAEGRAAVDLARQVADTCDDWRVLVNNASIFEPGGFLETDEAKLDRNFAVNFKAPFLLTQAFARAQRERPTADTGLTPCVVNLLDARVARTVTDHFAYTLAKKALHDLNRMAAKALAPVVRVNAVCPGVILPPPGEDESILRRLSPRVPMRTHGSPTDVADAVLYLIEGNFLTGEAIFVDGGDHLR